MASMNTLTQGVWMYGAKSGIHGWYMDGHVDINGYFDTGCMVLRVASMDGTWMAMYDIHGYFDTGCMGVWC